MIRMWEEDKPKKITTTEKRFIEKRIKSIEKNPERLIPLDVALKKLRSHK